MKKNKLYNNDAQNRMVDDTILGATSVHLPNIEVVITYEDCGNDTPIERANFINELLRALVNNPIYIQDMIYFFDGYKINIVDDNIYVYLTTNVECYDLLAEFEMIVQYFYELFTPDMVD